MQRDLNWCETIKTNYKSAEERRNKTGIFSLLQQLAVAGVVVRIERRMGIYYKFMNIYVHERRGRLD